MLVLAEMRLVLGAVEPKRLLELEDRGSNDAKHLQAYCQPNLHG